VRVQEEREVGGGEGGDFDFGSFVNFDNVFQRSDDLTV